jgi:hypothetical protein
MRLLIVFGLAIVTMFACMPWLKSHLDDAGFRQDMAVAPGLLESRKGASASLIAGAVRARARERGIDLPEDGLRVEVSPSRNGTYRVAAGTMRVTANAMTSVQDVTIDASYDQPVFKLFKRHVKTQVVTMQPGDGPGSVYPESRDAVH